MMDSQFIRIETIAGGSLASNRSIIKALRSRLSVEGKSRSMRQVRHDLIRECLVIHHRMGA